MLGPRRLIGPVMAQIDVLDVLRRGARPPHTDPAAAPFSRYGEMVGWLLQDSGDLDGAASWSRRAEEWAQCVGDATMAAYMLIRQANLAALADVVQLAAAARRTPGSVDPEPRDHRRGCEYVHGVGALVDDLRARAVQADGSARGGKRVGRRGPRDSQGAELSVICRGSASRR
jgi:hypothetical protein